MNRLLIILRISLLILTVAGSIVGFAAAQELGSRPGADKPHLPPGLNPGTPDGRQGGEDIATAFPIPALPYSDTGNTSDNIHDFDPMCPFDGSLSPDVFYSYTPLQDEVVRVDLCGSGYDTCLGIYDIDGNLLFCNDDFYFDANCGYYVSCIEFATFTAGQQYFIDVDGYGGDSGDYVLNITYVVPDPPCDLVCAGMEEGEPPLEDGYIDAFNGGCNSSEPMSMMQELTAGPDGELVFCGKSGWYLAPDDSEFRDTDWFLAIIGPSGSFEWTLDAEQESFGFLLGPNNCDAVGVEAQMTAGPCAPVSMTVTGDPGQVVWLWVGPTDFTGPFGFEGHEYNYISSFTGLFEGPVATDQTTFGGIKSLYR